MYGFSSQNHHSNHTSFGNKNFLCFTRFVCSFLLNPKKIAEFQFLCRSQVFFVVFRHNAIRSPFFLIVFKKSPEKEFQKNLLKSSSDVFFERFSEFQFFLPMNMQFAHHLEDLFRCDLEPIFPHYICY